MDQAPNNVGDSYGYTPYGYELTNLMKRYGVQSPVAPRKTDGLSDADYQAMAKNYASRVQSTPMYNIPTGNQTYKDLVKNVLYGNPAEYFGSRGITNPLEMWKNSDVFGWQPQQIDMSYGNPTGSYQNWVDTASGNKVSPSVRQPVNPYPDPSKPQQPQQGSPNGFSPDELAYSLAHQPANQGAPLIQQTQEDWWNQQPPVGGGVVDLGGDYLTDIKNLIGKYKTGSSNDYAKANVLPTDPSLDQTMIDGAEASTLFNLAERYNVSPEQMASLFDDPNIGAAQVVNRLKNDLPHDSYNYLKAHGYAEGGQVEEDDGLGELSSSELRQLLKKYDDRATKRETELETAKAASRGVTNQARELLTKIGDEPGDVPSKAELWWKLAAAFAAPSKTGSFGEGLGQAASAVSEHKSATRTARQTAKERRQRAGLEVLGLDAKQASEELETARELAKSAGTDSRTITGELLRSNRPKSSAGQQAVDEGLTPGTPEYKARVKAINDRPSEMQALRERAELSASEARAAQQRQREVQNSRMSSSETKALMETEDLLQSSESALGMLREAKNLNKDTYDTSLKDLVEYKTKSLAGSTDPKVVNTRLLENLLATQAVEKLRASFGGSPTEGERQILLDLQGIGAKSLKERASIIDGAIERLQNRMTMHKGRLTGLKQGRYRTYEETEDAP